MELRNRRWTEEELFQVRKEVLAQWPTGKDVDLDEGIAYRLGMPEHKRFVSTLVQAKAKGRVLVMPMAGHAMIEDTLDHMRACEEAGSELLYSARDSYTRKSKFDEAQRALEESIKQGKSLMNGLPIVNYGVKAVRTLNESLNVPVMAWACVDEDPRLQAEIALASGMDNGSISLNNLIQHCKDYPLQAMIQNQQYINRLAAYYTERGSPVNVLIAGNLQGWEPPGLKLVHTIMDCMLVAQQGVKHIALNYGLTAHLVQDVAAQRVQRLLSAEYLARFGHEDVQLTFAPTPWSGSWPNDIHRGCAVHAWSVVIALFGGANWLWLRSPQEGMVIARKEGNVMGVKIAKQLISMLSMQRMPDSEELRLEEEMIRHEVRAVLDKVLEMGDGDLAIGMGRAVEAGVIDNPFPSWLHLKGKVLPVRDNNGAIRYLDHHNIPLPREVVQYHREKIAERERSSGLKADIEMVIRDIPFASGTLALLGA